MPADPKASIRWFIAISGPPRIESHGLLATRRSHGNASRVDVAEFANLRVDEAAATAADFTRRMAFACTRAIRPAPINAIPIMIFLCSKFATFYMLTAFPGFQQQFHCLFFTSSSYGCDILIRCSIAGSLVAK